MSHPNNSGDLRNSSRLSPRNSGVDIRTLLVKAFREQLPIEANYLFIKLRRNLFNRLECLTLRNSSTLLTEYVL
jgi:hypothetical protein